MSGLHLRRMYGLFSCCQRVNRARNTPEKLILELGTPEGRLVERPSLRFAGKLKHDIESFICFWITDEHTIKINTYLH